MFYNPGFIWENYDLYYKYIKDINKYPILSKNEEIALFKEIRVKNSSAFKRLICANLKFVINIAFVYQNRGLGLLELINEGNLGLIEAAKRFDLSKNTRFISYAVWWIRQSITRALTEKARLVRISAEKELLLCKINKQHAKLKQFIGGDIRVDSAELSKKIGRTPRQIEEIIEMGQNQISLNKPVNPHSSASLIDAIENDRIEKSDEKWAKKSRKNVLMKFLKMLSVQEQKVLKMYFGINFHNAMSLEDIGDVIGLSKERVRQIKEKGLENLRNFEIPRELLLAA